MNLAFRGIEANLGLQAADSFLRNLHPDLKADFLLANPFFNDSDWSGHLLQDDVRWRFGTPPPGNANYAWIQHFIHHLAPPNGRGGGVAGFVMAKRFALFQLWGRGGDPPAHTRVGVGCCPLELAKTGQAAKDMAKGQPLPPGSPLQLRGLQRAGHSSNWAIARSLRATSPGRGQKGTPLTIRRNQWFRRWGNCEFEKEIHSR